MQGLTWRPLVCGGSDIVEVMDVCAGFSGFVTSDQPSTPQYVPPVVAVGMSCSAISGTTVLEETRERATALLDRCQTLGIARELWRGDAAQAANPDLPNDYLNDSSGLTQVASGASVSAMDSLANLEKYLATCSCAGNGMIHATPYTVTLWKHLQLVDRQPDGRIVTVLGTTVIADPGYDGSAPGGAVDATGATAWAYATGPIDVRLGPVTVLPAGELGESLVRSNNDWDVFAYRAFAATMDPCCKVAVKVDHATLT